MAEEETLSVLADSLTDVPAAAWVDCGWAEDDELYVAAYGRSIPDSDAWNMVAIAFTPRALRRLGAIGPNLGRCVQTAFNKYDRDVPVVNCTL